MGAHARKNASGCKRWSACPGSLRLGEGRTNESSAAAREGTAAHGLGEYCLKRPDVWPVDLLGGVIYLDDSEDAQVIPPIPDDGEVAVSAEAERLGHKSFEIDADMVDAVTVYVSAVREELECLTGAELMVERRFDLSWLRHDMFGTNDAGVLQLFDHATVFDYKHGRGVVVEVSEPGNWAFPGAEDIALFAGAPFRAMRGNPQEMYYALGMAHEIEWAFETLDLVIVQPRARHADGGVRRYRTNKAELREFQEWLGWSSDQADAASDAVNGNIPNQLVGSFLKEGGFLSAGKHCQFCPAAGIPCPALMDRAFEDAKLEFDEAGEPEVPCIDEGSPDDQLALALAAVPMLDVFIKAVTAEGLRRLKESDDGTGFGYKLVRKKSNRAWLDNTTAFAELVHRGYDVKDLYEEPKPKSPSKVEALRPAKLIEQLKADKVKAPVAALKAIVAELTHKPEGGVTMAPMSDPRDPVAPSSLAASDFDAVEEE